ncbi:condensation domain-containing protein [Nocardia tenerifensis]|uniref:Condensation domain-containing protein n=1 Tax=Nocardia tenerifensis TaxID=228006 RepID=A0A318JTN3_9NOCA|nr:condensation domain-containing protein [Nocardia tenerifensis]PXX55589.1 condensation domain-containing protein [Nocardia tenerifensis]
MAETRLPLTPGQHMLDFLESIRPGGAAEAFNISFRLAVDGPLDRGRLFDAVVRGIERHEALRTGVVRGRGMAEQVIGSASEPEMTVLPVAPEAWDVAEDTLVEHNNAPFDLAHPPLVRVLLLENAPDERRLLQVTVHHSVADAWSLEVLKHDVGRFYRAAAGLEPEPAPLDVHYRQIVRDELAALESPAAEEARAFWPEYIGSLEVLQIAGAEAGQALTSRSDRGLTSSESAAVQGLAGKLRATPFMVLAAAYGCLLGHLGGCEAYLMPTFSHGRRDPRYHQTVAMLFNPFLIGFRWTPRMAFAELVAAFKRSCLSAYRFQWYPFIEVLEVCPDLSVALIDPHSALFPVQMLNVPKASAGPTLFGPDCVATDYALHRTSTGNVLPIDGLLTIKGTREAMAMTFNAAQRLWNDELAAALCASVVQLCLDAACDPDLSLGKLVDRRLPADLWSI